LQTSSLTQALDSAVATSVWSESEKDLALSLLETAATNTGSSSNVTAFIAYEDDLTVQLPKLEETMVSVE